MKGLWEFLCTKWGPGLQSQWHHQRHLQLGPSTSFSSSPSLYSPHTMHIPFWGPQSPWPWGRSPTTCSAQALRQDPQRDQKSECSLNSAHQHGLSSHHGCQVQARQYQELVELEAGGAKGDFYIPCIFPHYLTLRPGYIMMLPMCPHTVLKK